MKALFGKVRGVVLEFLLHEGAANAAEIARATAKPYAAVHRELRHLCSLGLGQVKVRGNCREYRLSSSHPALRPLRQLFQVPLINRDELALGHLVAKLATLGAPLATKAAPCPDPEMTLAEALLLSHHRPELLRVLPITLACQAERLDFPRLVNLAKERGEGASLGLLLELAARLPGQQKLRQQARQLRDRRCSALRYYSPPPSSFEAELCRRNTPAVALRWGYWLNAGEDWFATLAQKFSYAPSR